MKKTVFFSWQSDLPNTSNRNFIEDSIKKAIKQIDNDERYDLALNLDRDTVSKQGTPDIVDSVFEKISKSCFFIADISLINGKSRKYRKTPNPNVLLELGVAVSHLGWERILCVFNTDYGKISDLPFDLRNRRIFTYQTLNAKSEEKRKLVSILREVFEENYERTLFANELLDYYNADIYMSIFRILTDISKTIKGYTNKENTIEDIKELLNMSNTQIVDMLTKKEFLGFQIFKSYHEHAKDIAVQFEKIVPIKNFNDDYYVPIVRLIHTLRYYNKELNRRGDLNNYKYLYSLKDKFFIQGKKEQQAKEIRMILIKKLDNEKGVVTDFGDFQRKDHIENLLTMYKLTENSINLYSNFYSKVISEVNQWIDNNNGEFILDDTELEFYKRTEKVGGEK